jgi:hypothetical protein
MRDNNTEREIEWLHARTAIPEFFLAGSETATFATAMRNASTKGDFPKLQVSCPRRCPGPYFSGSKATAPSVTARPRGCAHLLPRVFRRHDDVVVEPTAGGLRPMRHQAKNRRHGLFIVPGVVGFALGNLDDACATHQKLIAFGKTQTPRRPRPHWSSAEKPFGCAAPCQSATAASQPGNCREI